MIIKIISVIAGVLVGMLVIALGEKIGHMIYPPPTNIDFNDPAQIAEMMKNLPFGALFSVIISYGFGAFFAGVTSTLINREKSRTIALLCGLILTGAGLMNLLMIPHPTWFWILSLIIFIPKALAGNYFTLKYFLNKQN